MNKMSWMLMVALALVGNVAFGALTEADLTPAAVKAAIEARAPEARRAYLQEVIAAINALPVDDETKAQMIVSAIRAAISGARQGGGGMGLIAEAYISTPANLLPAVAKLLQPNFSQETNKMTDEAYDTFCLQLINNVSEGIGVSGADAPATRMAILAATFIGGASDPDRVRESFTNALPASIAAIAPTLVAAAEANNVERLAASAGVDEVTETPADPDKVVRTPAATEPTADDPTADDATADADADSAPQAQTDYLTPEGPEVVDADDEDSISVAVPLLPRSAGDLIGGAMDMHMALQFDWEGATAAGLDVVDRDTPIPTYIGVGNVSTIPGFAEAGVAVPALPALPEASPSYGNQSI